MERAQSCAEIAEDLGTTRQNVNQILKRSIGKVYKKMLYEKQITSTALETIQELIRHFRIENEDDLKEFYKILPQ